ncbi:hypothetical protein myaer102_42980 [Microcystis viridis NIES-102]|uniref:Uncharacterized protein n=1 Tax=Microcystis viridis NIES-102 TaxID=213615 RepID=A0A3G9K730_MICVR|nr:hypothetical protein [Microcystis viridis]BBH41680.1 hypothetical protein myaer102_42980 [Microcystis viridis NIES-102]
MKRTQKPEIIASVIGGIFQLVAALAAAYAAWYLNAQQIEQLNKVQKNNAGNIEKLNREVFKPRIIIESPYKDEKTDWILPEVKGTVKGEIPSNSKILVGHRGITEQNVKIHADRIGEVLSDRSFVVDKIYLGSEAKGVGEKFEIIVLLVSEETWLFGTWYGSIGGHKSTQSLSGKRFN